MFDYKSFLADLNMEAYHAGEFQWEEDGYTVTRTYHYSPPGCHDSCGILLYVKDGKLCKVEGDPLDPVANGKLCMRCLDLPEAVNHPDRLKYPMKRAGERGENKWERITWDEAYDTIEAKVRDIWATEGGNAIYVFHGTGRNINWQVPYFAKVAFKTPNIGTFGFTGFSCYLPRVCGSMAPLGDYPIADASVGHADRYANPEWKAPEVVVIWGNEPLKSNGDGYLGHWLNLCAQLGSKIICIDPRVTWWATHAEYHLQIRPGTDTALASAWLNVIINEGLYDQEFVSYWCAGLDELADAMDDKTPEWASEITGIPVDDIIGSARLYASGQNSAIQWGLAFDQQISAMSLNLAVCDLMAITGNIDVPGGNILVRNAFNINSGYSTGEDQLPPEWAAKKLSVKNTFHRGADFVSLADSDAMLYALETDDPFPVKMIWCQSSNTIACPGMDSPRVYKALQRCPFVVNADPYITPFSVAFADIILPVAMSPERNSARTWWTPCRTMYKACDFFEAKSDEEIIVDVTKRLNPEVFEGINDDVDLVNWYMNLRSGSFIMSDEGGAGGQHLAGGVSEEQANYAYLDVEGNLFDEDFESLSKKGGAAYDKFNATYKKYEKGLLRPDGSVGFATPSGRIELTPVTFKMWQLSTTPVHVEPTTGPISTPEMMEEYPLILTCGGRSYEFFHSEHRQLSTMREFHPDPLVTINPKTAEKYGIEDGQWVWIENERGRCLQKASVNATVNEKTVHAEHGWWFPEQEAAEPSLFGVFNSNVNNMTRAFLTGEGDIGSSIKSMICKVYPYKEGDTMPNEVVIEGDGFNKIIPGQA